MKATSLIPWIQNSKRSERLFLLFGLNDSLLFFRLQWLKKHFSSQGFDVYHSASEDDFLKEIQGQETLFEQKKENLRRCFVYERKDSSIKKPPYFDLLVKSPHIFVMTSGKATSRAPLTEVFQNHPNAVALGCYDGDIQEIDRALSRYEHDRNLKICPSARPFLRDILTTQLEEFFPILDFLGLYGEAASTPLTDQEIKEALKGFSTGEGADGILKNFFMGNSAAVYTFSRDVDPASWISLIRQLLYDVTTLLLLNTHQVSRGLLKSFWAKGVLKFPYGKIPLYESILNTWPLRRCGRTLRALLDLELRLKSTTPPCFTEIQHILVDLSSGAS